MIILYIFLLIVPSMLIGMVIGLSLRDRTYHGIIKMVEQDGTLIYSLELVSDPELLAFQKEVRFKVVPPNYKDLKEIEDHLSQ